MTISIQSLSDASSDVFSKAAASYWSNNNLVGGIPTDNDAASNVLSSDDVAKTITASLNEPLKQYCEDFINSKCPSSANEKVDNFEIATRGHLLSLVQTLLNANECNDIAVIEESIEDILRFFRGVIDIAVYVAKNASLDVNTSQLRKLPFVLIEDVVETIPISLIQIIWKYGPSVWLQSILCQSHLNMFHQGSKYCLIRMCNRLLKNLSVSSQDEAAHFAGEISLIMASVFPLSERSAVNVLGAFHTDEKYQVEHETLEEWTENSIGEGGSSVAGATKNGDSSGGKKIALTYGFYSKFWSLQKIFTDPRGLLPKSGANWNQNMERFIMDVQDILGTFDGYKFSNDLVKHLNENLEAMMRKVIRQTSQLNTVDPDVSGDVEMEDITRIPSPTSNMTKAKRQYKYLTSSHLLHLQLQDPELRIHFLSQLLIISSFLSKSLSEALTSVGNTIADKVVLENFQNNLQGVEKNAEELIRQIPPNGESHLNALKWILHDRETAWRDWKSKKCLPIIEKFAESVENTEGQTKKLDSGKDGSINATALKYIYDLNLVKDLPKISREMSQEQSMMDAFFEEYVDALDPEAGIENEYHPKNNMLSCWRALRLITKNHIGHLGERDGKSMMNKKTGDFEGIIRHIWKNEKGIEIPGEMPSSESISDDENLDDQLQSNDAVASDDLMDEKEREDENALDLNTNDVKDPDIEQNERGAITPDVDEKIEDIKMPSTENELMQGDEKEAGEISDVNELSSTKDESTPTNATNATNEEEVITDHGAEETHVVSNAGTGVHDSEQEPNIFVDDAGKSEKLSNLNTKIIDHVTADSRDNQNGGSLNDKGSVGKKRRHEESDQSENDDNKRRRKDVGTSNLDTQSEKQQPQESDQKGEENVQESVNAPSTETNDSIVSGKHDVEKNVESSTTLAKEGTTSKVQESAHTSNTETNDSTLSRKHDVEKTAKTSTASAKVASASIDRKTLQSNENASLKSDSAVKATSNIIRDDVRRSNTKYGMQSGSHSFNNPSGNRRGDNRRQENRPRSPRPLPPPPHQPRREHTRESRSGHGTHTRFFSPDGRDDWAMANRGAREYGARGHGDMGNRRANKNDGRGQNRRRERR